MHKVPENIIEASLINENTGDKILLVTKDYSYCHFVPDDKRYTFGAYEIRFRLDWKDSSDENDPKLDADLFDSNGSQIKDKKLLQIILGSLHHTFRSFDVEKNKYTYQFGNDQIVFVFTTQLKVQVNQTGTAIIIQE